MSDLSELYQEVILDHNQRPRNFHVLDGSARRADGHNPLCGDRLTLFLDVRDGVVRDVGFQGSGCAISKASASMMTDAIKGHTEDDAVALFRLFHDLVTGVSAADDADPRLGKLVVFAGVRDYPVRVKCATLAWHTLRAALDNHGSTASTE
ncbi:MAG TPA: SUF system NifU family Fe-S cluster assembly protein [Dongiaceae bacterium]|nr:SUF system NifU family Fe-S cluster assembly protein [Dongiaceae bacterium]